MSDQPERKQFNFTIVADEKPGEPRVYANFCAISHTPFDFTLTFCEVMPLSPEEVRNMEARQVERSLEERRALEAKREAHAMETGHEVPAMPVNLEVRAPVRARIAVPVQFVPQLITALQDHMRVFAETYSNVGWTKQGPIH
jgi:hypothetical protein